MLSHYINLDNSFEIIVKDIFDYFKLIGFLYENLDLFYSKNLINSIIDNYQAINRYYHNDKHIISNLKYICNYINLNPKIISEETEAALYLATLYHDFHIYSIYRDELLSAGRLEKDFKLSGKENLFFDSDNIGIIEKARRLILITKYNPWNFDRQLKSLKVDLIPAKLMLDADYSIFEDYRSAKIASSLIKEEVTKGFFISSTKFIKNRINFLRDIVFNIRCGKISLIDPRATNIERCLTDILLEDRAERINLMKDKIPYD